MATLISVLKFYLCIPDKVGLVNNVPLSEMLKCKKHFTKMLKDVEMVVPKIKETR